MLHILQIATVMFGVVTVCLSIYLAYRFLVLKHSLGLALGLMLFGEAVSGAVAVFFSLTSALHVYNTMSPVEAMMLRWLIFSVTAGTSIHLYYVMKNHDT